MFTGIVEEQGVVKDIRQQRNLMTFSVRAREVIPGTRVGESIAVSGVCLTVSAKGGRTLQFAVMKETLAVTTLGRLKRGDRVNLERALKADGRFGGHFVSGHVDSIGTVKRAVRKGHDVEYTIFAPKACRRYLLPKGSVCVDGVSLTVGKVGSTTFSVYLIPHTLKTTTLGVLRAGQPVNIEVDLLAKYVLAAR